MQGDALARLLSASTIDAVLQALLDAGAAIAEAALSAVSARLHQADVARATLTPSLLHDAGGINV